MQITNSIPLSVIVTRYGQGGADKIFKITLCNEHMAVELTNIGCAITAIRIPDKRNIRSNIVACYTDLLKYRVNKDYFGCVVGRFTNRIANGRFSIDGKTYQLSVNNGSNHLHGGIEGFSRRLWDLQEVIENDHECGISFSYFSPDGEEGYPGNLSVTVKYLLDKFNRLKIFYNAVSDQSTPVSLTNHSYFNLSGFQDPVIYNHRLSVEANAYTAKSINNTSTGEIVKVEGTALDFQTPKLIGKDIDAFPNDMGIDHSFIIKNRNSRDMLKAATLSEAKSGRIVTVYTDRPAIQVYTGNFWNGSIVGEQGIPYIKHGGVALETQAFPDSPNHANFPCTILKPGELYETTTLYEFGVLQEG